MRELIFVAAVAFATPAAAAPTYLVCTFESKEGKPPVLLDVTADEANGQVTTLVQSTGHMEKRPAIFSPTAVKWSGSGSFGLSYNLSRTDLTLERVLSINGSSFPNTAKCEIQETPKRAF